MDYALWSYLKNFQDTGYQILETGCFRCYLIYITDNKTGEEGKPCNRSAGWHTSEVVSEESFRTKNRQHGYTESD